MASCGPAPHTPGTKVTGPKDAIAKLKTEAARKAKSEKSPE
jgi:hypothetical protein